jgi:hypothetical protein
MCPAISGDVGIDVVCDIEEHCCLGIRAQDLHDTFEVLALVCRSKTPLIRM